MPALRNTIESYGLISILLHWLVALTVFGLIALGLWMVELNYYSPWYKLAPFWHKSIGLSLAAVLVARLLWRLTNPQPKTLPSHRRWEVRLAHAAHALLSRVRQLSTEFRLFYTPKPSIHAGSRFSGA
jgi:Cytochrome B561